MSNGGFNKIDGGSLLFIGVNLHVVGSRIFVDGQMSHFLAGTSGRISSFADDAVAETLKAAEHYWLNRIMGFKLDSPSAAIMRLMVATLRPT